MGDEMRIIILEVVQCSEEKALRSEVGEMGNQSTTFGKESDKRLSKADAMLSMEL